MGREVRKVPPNWNHPTIEQYGRVDKQPMRREHFDEAFKEWLDDFDRIRSGNSTDDEKKYYPNGLSDWLEDYRPPKSKYYRPWKDEDATWFQVWETVSEGTPVTPPFETKKELVEHLVKYGDEWDQKRRNGGWKQSAAESFIKDEWAPSMVVLRTPESVTIHQPRDGSL